MGSKLHWNKSILSYDSAIARTMIALRKKYGLQSLQRSKLSMSLFNSYDLSHSSSSWVYFFFFQLPSSCSLGRIFNKLPLLGQWNLPVCKGTCCQMCWPEFCSRDPCGELKGLITTSFPLSFTPTVCQVHTHAHTHNTMNAIFIISFLWIGLGLSGLTTSASTCWVISSHLCQ